MLIAALGKQDPRLLYFLNYCREAQECHSSQPEVGTRKQEIKATVMCRHCRSWDKSDTFGKIWNGLLQMGMMPHKSVSRLCSNAAINQLKRGRGRDSEIGVTIGMDLSGAKCCRRASQCCD